MLDSTTTRLVRVRDLLVKTIVTRNGLYSKLSAFT